VKMRVHVNLHVTLSISTGVQVDEKEKREQMREPGLLIIDHPLPYCTPKGSLLMFAHRTLTLASTSIIDYELTNANETRLRKTS